MRTTAQSDCVGLLRTVAQAWGVTVSMVVFGSWLWLRPRGLFLRSGNMYISGCLGITKVSLVMVVMRWFLYFCFLPR